MKSPLLLFPLLCAVMTPSAFSDTEKEGHGGGNRQQRQEPSLQQQQQQQQKRSTSPEIRIFEELQVVKTSRVAWKNLMPGASVFVLGEGQVTFTGLHRQMLCAGRACDQGPYVYLRVNAGCGEFDPVQFGADSLKRGKAAIYNGGQVVIICN